MFTNVSLVFGDNVCNFVVMLCFKHIMRNDYEVVFIVGILVTVLQIKYCDSA